MIKELLILAPAAILAGCASSGTQVKDSSLAQFQKGVTTEAQIEKTLGAPQTTTVDADGSRSIGYLYTAAHAKGATFIPVVGLFAGGSKGESKAVRFKFDHDGKLASYETSTSAIDIRTGIIPASSESSPQK